MKALPKLKRIYKKKNEDTVLPYVKIGDSLDIKDKEIKKMHITG